MKIRIEKENHEGTEENDGQCRAAMGKVQD
jgi:hypothetical protein